MTRYSSLYHFSFLWFFPLLIFILSVQVSPAPVKAETTEYSIDAVFMKEDGKVYFFKGDKYMRYDHAKMKIDPGYPKKIATSWLGVTFSSIDAALIKDETKVFFFKGDEYIRFDLKAMKADEGYPKKIEGSWPGMTFTSGVDAAVNVGNGKVYFFKGDEYIRFDLTAMKADEGYPRKIATSFLGMPFPDKIDDAFSTFNRPDYEQKIFFFKGDQFASYDIPKNKIDAGYPNKISASWIGLKFPAAGQ